jgi:raffinose/stachyose/melibiose transport system permease protein
MKFQLRNIPERLFSYGVMLFTVLISIFPILWVIMSSFKTNKEILGDPFSLPTSISFQVYVDVFTHYNFLVYFKNSFMVSITATLISVFLFSLAGYIFGKFDFWGKSTLYILGTMTLLVPGYALQGPIFNLIMRLHLYDTKAALILVYTSGGVAMALFILKISFQSVSKEFDEAAIIDGAGFWRVFWSVNVPLAKSGITTSAVLSFLGNWNEYYYGVILTTSKENRTLPVAVGFFTEAFSYNYTRLFAALVMVIVPGLLIYAIAQEQIQKSVASSGVKG